MTPKEYNLTVQAFIEEIQHARKKRDFELLDALSGDLKNYLWNHAAEFKGFSEYCERIPKGFLSQNRTLAKERAKGKCELCGKRGTQTHHLCGRSPLKVYHLSELLIYLCCECHRKFHGGG